MERTHSHSVSLPLAYKRPTSKPKNILKYTNDILNYIKHNDISKINDLNSNSKLSEILEYYYLADAYQIHNLKDEIRFIINEKMFNIVQLCTTKARPLGFAKDNLTYSTSDIKLIERKSKNIYMYDSKLYDIEYDCNCEKIIDAFKEILKNMDTQLKSFQNTHTLHSVVRLPTTKWWHNQNYFEVYIYCIEYLQLLITEYLAYRKDRIKTINTIYTIYKYILNNIELYLINIPKTSEGVNIENIDYLLNIVDPKHKSKIIELLEVNNWSVADRWNNIRKLEQICTKYNLEYAFLNKIKTYLNCFYDNNDIRNSKL